MIYACTTNVTQNSFYTADNLIVSSLNFVLFLQQNKSNVYLSTFLLLFKLIFFFFRLAILHGKLFKILMPVQYRYIKP
jgi:hypothetical protein